MEVVYGINPLRMLLARPKARLKKILIAEGRSGSPIADILELAGRKKIPVERKNRKFIDQIAGRPDHQGIVGLCEDFAYADLDDLIKNRHPLLSHDLILMLDHVVDPQNLGSIIRTGSCFGANGVIIPADRAASVTPAVLKASAGGAELLPVARVTNLSATLDEMKKKGFWVFGADVHGGRPLEEQHFDCPVVLVMGSESAGLKPLVKKKCDFMITLPMAGNFDSLNVAVAAGIIQYEIFNRRRHGKKDQVNAKNAGL